MAPHRKPSTRHQYEKKRSKSDKSNSSENIWQRLDAMTFEDDPKTSTLTLKPAVTELRKFLEKELEELERLHIPLKKEANESFAVRDLEGIGRLHIFAKIKHSIEEMESRLCSQKTGLKKTSVSVEVMKKFLKNLCELQREAGMGRGRKLGTKNTQGYSSDLDLFNSKTSTSSSSSFKRTILDKGTAFSSSDIVANPILDPSSVEDPLMLLTGQGMRRREEIEKSSSEKSSLRDLHYVLRRFENLLLLEEEGEGDNSKNPNDADLNRFLDYHQVQTNQYWPGCHLVFSSSERSPLSAALLPLGEYLPAPLFKNEGRFCDFQRWQQAGGSFGFGGAQRIEEAGGKLSSNEACPMKPEDWVISGQRLDAAFGFDESEDFIESSGGDSPREREKVSLLGDEDCGESSEEEECECDSEEEEDENEEEDSEEGFSEYVEDPSDPIPFRYRRYPDITVEEGVLTVLNRRSEARCIFVTVAADEENPEKCMPFVTRGNRSGLIKRFPENLREKMDRVIPERRLFLESVESGRTLGHPASGEEGFRVNPKSDENPNEAPDETLLKPSTFQHHKNTLSFVVWLKPLSIVDLCYLPEGSASLLSSGRLHLSTDVQKIVGLNTSTPTAPSNFPIGDCLLNFSVFPLSRQPDDLEEKSAFRRRVGINMDKLKSPNTNPTVRHCGILPVPDEFLCSQGWGGPLTHFLHPSTFFAYDFDAPVGTPVLAMARGTIVEIRQTENGEKAAFGPHLTNFYNWNQISIELEPESCFCSSKTKLVLEYVHLLDIDKNLKIGDFVEAGEKIGRSGRAGFTPTPHLHVQVNMESKEEVKDDGDDGGLGQSIPFTIQGVICVQGQWYGQKHDDE